MKRPASRGKLQAEDTLLAAWRRGRRRTAAVDFGKRLLEAWI